jgi:DNA repair protein RadD
MAALAAGEINVITNCSLISEGFDAPAVGALLIMRPTQSLALHLQMIGRALRTAPGKDRAIILDHAGNVFRHGLPDQDRVWSLDAAKRKAPGEREAPVKTCPECSAVVAAGAGSCPNLGFQFAGREIEHVDGALVEVTTDPAQLAAMTYRQAISWAGPDRTRLRHVAWVRGYKAGWVYHRLIELQGGASP